MLEQDRKEKKVASDDPDSAAGPPEKARGHDRADSLLEGQKEVLERIARGEPLRMVLDALCRIVEANAAEPVRAAILLVDPDGSRLVTGAAPSLPEEYLRAIDGGPIDPWIGTCSAAAALRQPVVTPDLATAPGWAALGHLPLGLNLRAAWSMPILGAEGRVLGTFGTYFFEAREPTAGERRLIEVLSRTAALAIERREADDRLRESEARYRAIVETTPECVKLVAADGTLLQINDAGLRMIEADRSLAIGRSIYEVIAADFRESYRAFHDSVCRGEGGTFEFDIVGARGTRRHMETTGVPLASPAGGFLHLAVTRDVTARVASARALDEHRARLDYAVRLSGVGFWYCDLPFDELVWDRQVKEHFWLPADARVTIDTFYGRIHPDDRRPTRAAIEESIRSRKPYDVIYRTVDPSTHDAKWIRALGGTTYRDDGTPIRFDGVTVDVTSLKRAEEALREADRRKDDFLALLAHELRNPLAPLRNGLQVMRLAGEDRTLSAQAREMMERQLGHMVRLIDDLLDVSRISRDKMELRRERILLSDAIAAAVETASPALEAAGHRWDVSLPGEPIHLRGDLTRLAQVFSNLLTNSAKYMERGGRVWITAATRGTDVVVAVRDTGIGIPAAAIASIFDMFSQVDRSMERSTGGLGIGLALVKGIVEMHGGTVAAASEGPGRGSTFTITLPILAERPAVSAPDGGSNAALPRGPLRRILVVDDNRDSAHSMASMLELLGHEVRVAHDGHEAVDCSEDFHPSIILMDVGMPRMNGYDAARRIRERPWARSAVIVALTGWGQEADRERSRVAGCDGHLVKPVKLLDLMPYLQPEIIR
ncbi:hybrid sensor histidine kinase/response regulator [Aquisphaera insulae]|uniref:hybrid sensor histidine kinase/response regulator n=1 Tax=Aquisphaera insulae TaxID=2712864 RepID=UPI0013EA845B|nr:ATP-binding protein [Aquisphaera insulae]